MPGFDAGFQVGGVGQGVAGDNLKPNYNYTWQVVNLLGTVAHGTPLVYVKDCTLPSVSFTKETVEASVEYKYASTARWDDVKIKFYDIAVSGQTLASVVRRWRQSVWTPTGGLQPSSNYKKTSQIEVYNLQWELQYTWTLYGCWPQTIREGDLTYTSSDAKVIEVVLTYDWAVLVVVGESTPGDGSEPS